MKLYKVNQEYLQVVYQIEYLSIVSQLLQGIIIMRHHGFIYFIPVDNIDESDYDNHHVLKKVFHQL